MNILKSIFGESYIKIRKKNTFRDYFGLHFSIHNYIEFSISLFNLIIKLSIRLRMPKNKIIFGYLFQKNKRK